MKPLRAVLRRLDPWAALLLGLLLAMGVIILLATPGPWHRVVGPAAKVQLAPAKPNDLAIFVRGTRGNHCTGVLWVHVDHARTALSIVVVSPQTQGSVAGGGFAPLATLVDDVGSREAAASLGRLLDVDIDNWLTIDRQALRRIMAPMYRAEDARTSLGKYRLVREAWGRREFGRSAWTWQCRSLKEALPHLDLENLHLVAFTNYVLGFGHVDSDLSLREATSLATTLREVTPAKTQVCAAPAIVEMCRGEEVWRLDQSKVESLRRSVVDGLDAPFTRAQVARRQVRVRVLVVVPFTGDAADTYVREVKRCLRVSAGRPVAVTVVGGELTDDLIERTVASADRLQPLAVFVGPADGGDAVADQTSTSPTGGASTDVAQARSDVLARLYRTLAARERPATVSSSIGTSAEAQDLTDVADSSGLPVSQVARPSASATPVATTTSTVRLAARAGVDTLTRACWPGVLSPRLTSTRRGFAYAATRHVDVVVMPTATDAGDVGAAHAGLVAWRVGLWGYPVTLEDPGGWLPEDGVMRAVTTLYYRDGYRAAALALGGDLGLDRRDVVDDDSAPASVTLVTAP